MLCRSNTRAYFPCGGPFAEQHRSGVVSAEVGGQGFFESATEQHCCTGVVLSPAIQVPISVAARTTEVLADLGKAVRHHATSGFAFLCEDAKDNSSHWLAGAKPSKLSREVHNAVADLHDPAKASQGLLVDFLASEQFGIVEEIPQEPA